MGGALRPYVIPEALQEQLCFYKSMVETAPLLLFPSLKGVFLLLLAECVHMPHHGCTKGTAIFSFS